MKREQEKKKYGIPELHEEFTLDDILAEFGRGGAEPALTESEMIPDDKKMPDSAEEKEPAPSPVPEEISQPAEEPEKEPDNRAGVPDRVSLKDLMSETVDSVLAENEDGILPAPAAFSQRLRQILKGKKKTVCRDTEELWTEPEAKKEEPPEEPEPDGEEADKAAKRSVKKLGRQTIFAAVPTLMLMTLTILEEWEILPPVWWENDMIRCGALGGLLLITAVLCFPVWQRAIVAVKNRQGGCELTALILTAVTLCHCICGAVMIPGEMPLAAVSALLDLLCLLALWYEAETRRESFHLVHLGGDPLYTLTNTELGLCKQKGKLAGFYHISDRTDPARRWQMLISPFLVSAATILSGLVHFTTGQEESFLRIWAVMLAASAPLSMPLNGVLPLYRLQSRLTKSGAAVAGYQGARAVSRSRRLVLTEDDVFPPGTVALNGYKVYGEERSRILSYAASMTKAAGSQLQPMLEQQLAAEGGFHMVVSDFQFLEEGGVAGMIHGERVVMGSAYFMRKQHIALPHDLKLQTGVYMAVDGVLTAIFVIKYQPSRNVEWALRALRRSHIRPVLASRSSNVTPNLVQRKFGVDARLIYPDVTTRLALSDVAQTHGGKPYAVLYREGLMPLTETFIGAKRLVKAVRWAAILTCFGALAGLLLTYYLTSVGNFAPLTPLNILFFGVLWLIPTVLISGLVRHY